MPDPNQSSPKIQVWFYFWNVCTPLQCLFETSLTFVFDCSSSGAQNQKCCGQIHRTWGSAHTASYQLFQHLFWLGGRLIFYHHVLQHAVFCTDKSSWVKISLFIKYNILHKQRHHYTKGTKCTITLQETYVCKLTWTYLKMIDNKQIYIESNEDTAKDTFLAVPNLDGSN